VRERDTEADDGWGGLEAMLEWSLVDWLMIYVRLGKSLKEGVKVGACQAEERSASSWPNRLGSVRNSLSPHCHRHRSSEPSTKWGLRHFQFCNNRTQTVRWRLTVPDLIAV